MSETADHPRANLNRALCNFLLEKVGYADGDFGVAYVERAVESFPDPDPIALLTAARIHSVQAKALSSKALSHEELKKARAQSVARIREYLEAAVEWGLPANLLQNTSELQPLATSSWFSELEQVAESSEQRDLSNLARNASYVVPTAWE